MFRLWLKINALAGQSLAGQRVANQAISVMDFRQYKMSARHMQAYNMKQDEDPRDVIAMDEAEVLVDKILDHTTRNSNRKIDFDFLVRWKGQGSEEDMWVPYSEVRPLAAFDEYGINDALEEAGIF